MIGTTRGRSLLATFVWLVGSTAVAFGIAISVRDFVVEAVIVPTGSMAMTLLGVHADVTCENCGCTFPISMSDYGRRPLGEATTKEVACWNCLHQQTFQLQGEPVNGDRALVDKTSMPRRWDLAVYWYPPRGAESPREGRAPGEHAPTRYIKRLVGLPGETLQLADGDVFIDGRRLRKKPGEQEDLWFPVLDSRYASSGAEPAWKAQKQENQWKFDGGVSFEGAGEGQLIFRRSIDTSLAYNTQPAPFEAAEVRSMGDVRMSCELAAWSGSGGFGFSWKYGGATVQAIIAASGDVSLDISGINSYDDGETLAQTPKPPAPGQRWSFAHRDGRVYVDQDGHVVASRVVGEDGIDEAVARSARQRRQSASSPEGDEPACHVGLLAHDCELRLARMRIDRDVYYLSMPSTGDVEPGEAVKLGADDYFVLGDNSAQSFDSRSAGPVQKRDFDGTIRAIFWPPSRWRAFP